MMMKLANMFMVYLPFAAFCKLKPTNVFHADDISDDVGGGIGSVPAPIVRLAYFYYRVVYPGPERIYGEGEG